VVERTERKDQGQKKNSKQKNWKKDAGRLRVYEKSFQRMGEVFCLKFNLRGQGKNR